MRKRVLITGGAGFIGHHLIEKMLRETEYEIVSLDRLDFSGNLGRLSEICEKIPDAKDRLKIVWHDLKAPLNGMIKDKIGPVDYIFHLAAGSHVDRSIEYPMEFVMDNVVGTVNLLDYARLHLKDKLELFLYFSTDEVFGPAPEGVFYEEDDRYWSGNPYAASKAGGEEMCLAYENTYKMPIVITHTMNVFGLRQHPEKFIPKVIKRIRDGEMIHVHSNSDCTKAGSRHYIHAKDVADAVLFLIENGSPGEKYNITGSEETDNEELVNVIAEIMDKKAIYELVDFHSARPGHDLRYALSSEKMGNLGWFPKKPFKERIREVVEWTLENHRWLGTKED
jgi:dTDP-glucose 4,6-dehydratase